ncbi:MAG: LPS export ABC transporter permease LptG [Desulfobacterales bacterium]|jgi:lipopolysaccharide export system permease protein|nr:LPS export ABC transporter permease LptG [Desulfobacterales bacterium]
MKTIDLYIGSSFIKWVFLLLAILAVLFSFIELLTQLDDVGKGAYGLDNAVIFMALTLPKRLLDLMPVSTLIGGIIALGQMADQRELLAMQAAGISVLRISAVVFVTGMLLVLASGLTTEMVVPEMEQRAHNSRSRALFGTGVTLSGNGFWARWNKSYIHVDKMLSEKIAADLEIFQFDAAGRLQMFTTAQSAAIQDNHQWILQGITQKIITKTGINIRHPAFLTLDSFLKADQVNLLIMPPYSLSTPDLILYIKALRELGQNSDQYALALWRKISIPLTTGAMAMLSLSFIFGSTRNISAGRRMTIGTLVGVLLYFADHLIMNLGLLFNLNPFFTAMIPVLLISGGAFWRLRRVV